MKILFIIYFIFNIINSFAQELFPTYQSASSLSKGVVNIKLSYRYFEEQTSKRPKHWTSVQLMYGLTSKITFQAEFGLSNHHYKNFGSDLSRYFYNHHLTSYQAATFKPEGIRLYAKYRFLSFDGYQKHFRTAVFAEGAYSFVAHDEAEPVLNTDNTGVGGGIIATYLNKKYAISLTGGCIYPFKYKQKEQNFVFETGDSYYITSSFGYRLLPVTYKSYEDVNLNLYFEMKYTKYSQAQIKEGDVYWNLEDVKNEDVFIYNTLKANKYIDGRIFVQLITSSYDRIELGIAFPLMNQSYNYFSPMYLVQYQVTLKKNKKLYK
jgi:hypothetical protein